MAKAPTTREPPLPVINGIRGEAYENDVENFGANPRDHMTPEVAAEFDAWLDQMKAEQAKRTGRG